MLLFLSGRLPESPFSIRDVNLNNVISVVAWWNLEGHPRLFELVCNGQIPLPDYIHPYQHVATMEVAVNDSQGENATLFGRYMLTK